MNISHRNFRLVPTPALIFFSSAAGWEWANSKLPNSFLKQAQVIGPDSMPLQRCEVHSQLICSCLLPRNLSGIRQLMTIKYLLCCQRMKPEVIDVFHTCWLFDKWWEFPQHFKEWRFSAQCLLILQNSHSPIQGCQAMRKYLLWVLQIEAHNAAEPPSLARQCRDNQLREHVPEMLWMASVTATTIAKEATLSGPKTFWTKAESNLSLWRKVAATSSGLGRGRKLFSVVVTVW